MYTARGGSLQGVGQQQQQHQHQQPTTDTLEQSGEGGHLVNKQQKQQDDNRKRKMSHSPSPSPAPFTGLPRSENTPRKTRRERPADIYIIRSPSGPSDAHLATPGLVPVSASSSLTTTPAHPLLRTPLDAVAPYPYNIPPASPGVAKLSLLSSPIPMARQAHAHLGSLGDSPAFAIASGIDTGSRLGSDPGSGHSNSHVDVIDLTTPDPSPPPSPSPRHQVRFASPPLLLPAKAAGQQIDVPKGHDLEHPQRHRYGHEDRHGYGDGGVVPQPSRWKPFLPLPSRSQYEIPPHRSWNEAMIRPTQQMVLWREYVRQVEAFYDYISRCDNPDLDEQDGDSDLSASTRRITLQAQPHHPCPGSPEQMIRQVLAQKGDIITTLTRAGDRMSVEIDRLVAKAEANRAHADKLRRAVKVRDDYLLELEAKFRKSGTEVERLDGEVVRLHQRLAVYKAAAYADAHSEAIKPGPGAVYNLESKSETAAARASERDVEGDAKSRGEQHRPEVDRGEGEGKEAGIPHGVLAADTSTRQQLEAAEAENRQLREALHRYRGQVDAMRGEIRTYKVEEQRRVEEEARGQRAGIRYMAQAVSAELQHHAAPAHAPTHAPAPAPARAPAPAPAPTPAPHARPMPVIQPYTVPHSKAITDNSAHETSMHRHAQRQQDTGSKCDNHDVEHRKDRHGDASMDARALSRTSEEHRYAMMYRDL